MTDFSFVLLYVDSPAQSARFYADLLGRPPVDSSPKFAMFPLRDGVMLGLWEREDVAPKAAGTAGASEVAFTAENAEAVDAVHAEWSRRGLKIAQAPTSMDFGRTFVALDPDGHRLRVFAPTRQ